MVVGYWYEQLNPFSNITVIHMHPYNSHTQWNIQVLGEGAEGSPPGPPTEVEPRAEGSSAQRPSREGSWEKHFPRP